MAAPVTLPLHGRIQQLEIRETNNGKPYIMGKLATEEGKTHLPFMVTARTYHLYSDLKVGDKALVGSEEGVHLPVLQGFWMQEPEPELRAPQGFFGTRV